MRFIAALIPAIMALALFAAGAWIIQYAPDNEIALDGLLTCGVGLLLVLVALVMAGAPK